MRGRLLSSCCLFLLVFALSAAPATFAAVVHRDMGPPPASLLGVIAPSEPIILSSGGDTTWLQVHSSDSYCPGDPNMGHGGEASGGPNSLETWCFEDGPGDSCGTNPPWDTNCFKHIDVRALPSQTGINFWHIDTYRTNQRIYCGSYELWCGSAALWQGQPVECGTWINPPGYGNQWNCIVQLALETSFDVAGGCTVYFDPRYDLECKYDYYYIDYLSMGPAPTYLETWKTLATFNGTSNTPNATCGDASKPNPDYYGNGDQRGAGSVNCNWEERSNPSWPAFMGIITTANLGTLVDAPKLRWRMTSDGAWSDMDGSGNTDGGAYLDNVMIYGDNPAGPGNASVYSNDFETGTLDPNYWSLPNPPGVTDQWHIVHDPDRPYEGGDGGDRTTCRLDSSFVYRARPEQGYRGTWKNGWYYRLMMPAIPIQNSGCVIQYDEYVFAYDYTCDYANDYVRFYDSDYSRWCPWIDPTPYIIYCCFGPQYDTWEDLSSFYSESAESVQYAWAIMDVSQPGETCRGKHQETDMLVDNVSVGFYDAEATRFSARGIDLLHDTFFTDLCGYNSFFDVYDADTVSHYSGGVEPPWEEQLVVNIADRDSIESAELAASIDGGATWVAGPMVLRELGWWDYFCGDFSGRVCPADFGLAEWTRGTEVWYYVRATDGLANLAYFPATASPSHPGHTGGREDYLEFSILPALPDTISAPRILLVDGHERRLYDWSPCLSTVTTQMPLEDIYEQTLTDAGYCYDKFDISGAGSNQHIHPVDYADYDAIVWFTGPYFSNYLFDKEAQVALRSYLASGGKVVLCGDRIAYDMEVVGEDSLGDEFLGGIMGSDYVEEMPSPFDYPYVYAVAGESVNVFGSPIAVDLDTIVVYRECPYMKDFSYVLANASPPAGYTAQPLMYVANPTVAAADEVIYTEYLNQGQCVYVNFDLCGSVSHSRGYCSGDAATPAPDFAAGTFDGRVELLRVILEDIFGLPSSGGIAGVPGVPGPDHGGDYAWSLGQSNPNPCVSSTQISYDVARTGSVRIRVYDAAGRLVRTLVDERKGPGTYVTAWDGNNRDDERVASGVYFCTMEAGGYKATKKMLVVK